MTMFFERRALFPPVPAQEMSPVAAPLASLFLFSGFALAQIFAPDCSLTWRWVSFTRRVFVSFGRCLRLLSMTRT